MSIRSKNKVSTNFNMSSMTDIVFLLLIFFVIASIHISPNGLDLLLPKSKATVVGAKKNLTVSITKELQFAVNGTFVDLSTLEQQMMSQLQDLEEPGVILEVDQGVPFEEVVKVMDIANRNKLKLVVKTDPS